MDEDKLHAKLSQCTLPLHDGIKIDNFTGFRVKLASFEEILQRNSAGAGNKVKFNDINSILAKKIDSEKHHQTSSTSMEIVENVKDATLDNFKATAETSAALKVLLNTPTKSLADEIFEQHAKFKAPEKLVDIKEVNQDTTKSVQAATTSTHDNEIHENSVSERQPTTTTKRRKARRKIKQITIEQLENLFKPPDESVDGSISSLNSSIRGKVDDIISKLDESRGEP